MEKARFSYNFGQSYVRNFGEPRLGSLPSDRDFINAHGSTGQIIKINGNTITIKDSESVEKNIVVSAQTVIRNMRQDVQISSLQINDFVVVLGSPDSQGQVNASLIRVLPSPAAMSAPAAQPSAPAPTPNAN